MKTAMVVNVAPSAPPMRERWTAQCDCGWSLGHVYQGSVKGRRSAEEAASAHVCAEYSGTPDAYASMLLAQEGYGRAEEIMRAGRVAAEVHGRSSLADWLTDALVALKRQHVNSEAQQPQAPDAIAMRALPEVTEYVASYGHGVRVALVRSKHKPRKRFGKRR